MDSPLLLVIPVAIAGFFVYRKVQSDRAGQDLWTEATDRHRDAVLTASVVASWSSVQVTRALRSPSNW